MMTTSTVLALLAAHFVGDFLLQTRDMGRNKSSSNYWLTIHVFVYSFCLLWFGPLFTLFNMTAHWATDYVTSRGTTALWKREKEYWFFALIGFDQLIHATTLIVSYPLLGGWS